MKKFAIGVVSFALSATIAAKVFAVVPSDWGINDKPQYVAAHYGNMESRYPLMSVLCYKSDMSLEIHIRTPDSVSYNHHAYPKVEVRLPMSQMWLPKDSWQYANGGEDIIIKTSMASVEQLLRLIENRGRIEVAARYGAGNGETIEQIHSIGAEFLKHYGDKWMRECEG